MKLTDIGIKFNTDKATYHKFTDAYDAALSNLRGNEISILEIGIWNGASLMMWNEYFPFAKIYGVDINPYTHLDTERIKTIIANQESREQLSALPDKLDVIVDDGGHTMLQQQLTLSVMFKKLVPGGIYILEDLHTSLPHFYSSYQSTPYNNSIKLLEDLKRGDVSKDSQYHISEQEFYDLVDSIETIEIIRISDQSVTSIIKKKRGY